MNAIYNPFKNKEFQSKHDVNVSALSDLAFSISFIFFVASMVFLCLTLFTIDESVFSKNIGMFCIILTSSYLFNIFAKKHLLKRLSDEQIEFLEKHKDTLEIDNVEDIFTKKDLIPIVDKAYEMDQKLYQSGERRKEKFILSNSIAPL